MHACSYEVEYKKMRAKRRRSRSRRRRKGRENLPFGSFPARHSSATVASMCRKEEDCGDSVLRGEEGLGGSECRICFLCVF
jgi:hypothetical protein